MIFKWSLLYSDFIFVLNVIQFFFAECRMFYSDYKGLIIKG